MPTATDSRKATTSGAPCRREAPVRPPPLALLVHLFYRDVMPRPTGSDRMLAAALAGEARSLAVASGSIGASQGTHSRVRTS